MSSNKCNLTFPQNNIYMVEKFEGSSIINTIAGFLKIEKNFKEEICVKIINQLIKLNDALRIKIKENENIPYQIIENYAYQDIQYIDMSNSTDIEITNYFEKSVDTSFNLFCDKLYDFTVIRSSEDSGYIFMKLHHIISDAWTFGQVINQLVKMYDNCVNNIEEEKNIPSYLEYICSETEYISSDKYLKDENFWKEYLNDISSPISIKAASTKLSNKAKRYSAILDKNLNDKIIKYTKENRVSAYTLFLAVLSTYIYRIKDSNDFVIGTPTLNRANFKEKQILGMFVSTMPIRIKIQENMKFVDLVKSIGLDTMAMFRHQKFPFNKTLEYIHKTTDIKGKIFNIMLSYQNARADIGGSDKYSTKWIFSKAIQDELEIHLLDMDNNGTLTINYDYLTDLFDDIEIEYLHTRIMAILENAIEDIDVNVENICIMSNEEKNKILYEFNDTTTDYPKDKTVIELFEEQVKLVPDNIALVFEESTLTYKELNEKVNQLAHYLKEEKSIKINDVVGVMIDKSFNLIIAILGILKAGAAYLPLDSNLPDSRIDYMIENSLCKFVISNIEKKEYLNINEINLTEKKVENLTLINNSNDLAYVMYTSGSTGNPKGTMMSHRNISKLVKNITYFNMNKIDNIFLAGNIVFDASMHEMWLCLLNGKTGYLICKDTLMNATEYEKKLLNVKNSLAIFTTQLLHQYAKFKPQMFKNVKYLVAGGDVMLYEYVKLIKDNCPLTNIINIYGPTECSAATTTYNVDSNVHPIPIGKPIDNSKCYILDSKMRLLPIFTDGELYIGGDGVGLGYINNEINNKKSFLNICIDNNNQRLYKSGDVTTWNEKGEIFFKGRQDFQIKIRGYRIEISEIQNSTINYPNIKEAYIIVREKENKKKLNMYITSNVSIDISDLKKHLSKVLPDYMIPNDILQIDIMPLTTTGKVDRNKLPEINNNNKITNYPKNDLERTLLSTFSNVLSNINIDVEDNLFELGLDSLQIANAILILKDNNIDLGYQDVYNYKTIREISNKLIENEDKNEYSDYIKNYDYTNINKLLNINYDNKIKNKSKIGNILLTGATGFLGSHILENIISSNEDVNVYCIVRNKTEDGTSRLRKVLINYFGINFAKYIGNRIKVIVMNLLDDNSEYMLNKIVSENNIKTVFNCVANVRHYGDKDLFYKINVEIVEKLINVCKNNNIRLVQISTLSVSGNGFEGSFKEQRFEDKKYFDEKTMYLGQNINNVYVYTKYISELRILEARLGGLDCCNIRVGNLMSRISDGKFQKNYDDNGFTQRVKFIIDNSIISKDIYKNNYLEFSPVDVTAKYIVELSKLNIMNPIYHLFNNNHVYIDSFINLLKKSFNINVCILEDDEFVDKVQNIIKNKNVTSYMVIISDLKENKTLNYTTDVIIKEDITNNVLNSLGLKWPKIDDKYLELFIKNIYNGKDIYKYENDN
ncbi:MAG: amino acid adenylation domain-containing protein [Clostridia bacterium]